MHLKRRWINRRVYEYFAANVAPLLGWRDPILVYQMGAVGSSSIRNSLFRCNDPATKLVLMSHEYFPIRHRGPERMRVDPELREDVAREIAHDERVFRGFSARKRIARRFREKFYTEAIHRNYLAPNRAARAITLVREPVAHNISMFFQVMHDYIGVGFERDGFTTEELIQIFLERFIHSRPLTWLDAELKSALGIDVYQHPFQCGRGYTVLSNGTVDLLVLRAELDDEAKSRAIGNFLGIEGFELLRSNVGSEKGYADAYRRFKQQIEVPALLLDRMYASKFARHFYSPAEIEAFRKRWRKGKAT